MFPPTTSQLCAIPDGRGQSGTVFCGSPRFVPAWACMLIILLIRCNNPSIELEIPKANIEQELRTKFPTSQTLGEIADITFRNPELFLGKHKKRLTVFLDAAVTPRSVHTLEITKGKIELSSTLTFHRKTARILLKDVSIDSIGFRPIFKEKLNGEFAAAMRMLAEEELEGLPVYVLKPGTPRRMIARMFLRKMTIQKDAIVVTLGV